MWKMKCINTLLQLLLSLPVAICSPVTGSGFVLPRDAPQGLLMWKEQDSFANYTAIPLPSNDNDNRTDIENDSNSSVKTIGPRTNPLPITKWGCNPLNMLTADDALEGTWRLKTHCDVRTKHGMANPQRSILAFHQGTGWTYCCNWGRSPGFNPCDSLEVAEAMDNIDARCGGRNTGWVYMHHWKKSYGREVDGVEICPGICPVGKCGMIPKHKADGVGKHNYDKFQDDYNRIQVGSSPP